MTLRDALHGSRPVLAPGVFDALSARMVEDAGFEAAFLTGSGVSQTLLGQPDVGLLTLTEMTRRIAEVTDVVSIPVIVDGDTGHGNAVNLTRTVRDFERAGAAAVMLEDQVFPKRCGHLEGRKELVSRREAELKIRAACEARRSDNFLIIARTDARSDYGLDEAIVRGRAYRQAGADVVFVEAPRSVTEFRAIAEALAGDSAPVPLMANMVEGGVTPMLGLGDLHDLGVRLVIYPTTLIRTFVHAATSALAHLRETGVGREAELVPLSEVNRLVDLPRVLDLQARLLPGDE